MTHRYRQIETPVWETDTAPRDWHDVDCQSNAAYKARDDWTFGKLTRASQDTSQLLPRKSTRKERGCSHYPFTTLYYTPVRSRKLGFPNTNHQPQHSQHHSTGARRKEKKSQSNSLTHRGKRSEWRTTIALGALHNSLPVCLSRCFFLSLLLSLPLHHRTSRERLSMSTMARGWNAGRRQIERCETRAGTRHREEPTGQSQPATLAARGTARWVDQYDWVRWRGEYWTVRGKERRRKGVVVGGRRRRGRRRKGRERDRRFCFDGRGQPSVSNCSDSALCSFGKRNRSWYSARPASCEFILLLTRDRGIFRSVSMQVCSKHTVLNYQKIYGCACLL